MINFNNLEIFISHTEGTNKYCFLVKKDNKQYFKKTFNISKARHLYLLDAKEYMFSFTSMPSPLKMNKPNSQELVAAENVYLLAFNKETLQINMFKIDPNVFHEYIEPSK